MAIHWLADLVPAGAVRVDGDARRSLEVVAMRVKQRQPADARPPTGSPQEVAWIRCTAWDGETRRLTFASAAKLTPRVGDLIRLSQFPVCYRVTAVADAILSVSWLSEWSEPGFVADQEYLIYAGDPSALHLDREKYTQEVLGRVSDEAVVRVTLHHLLDRDAGAYATDPRAKYADFDATAVRAFLHAAGQALGRRREHHRHLGVALKSRDQEIHSRRVEAGMMLIELARLWTVDAIAVPGRDETTAEIMECAGRWLKKATGSGTTRINLVGTRTNDLNLAAAEARDEIRPILELARREHQEREKYISDRQKLERPKHIDENEKNERKYGRDRALWPKKARDEDAADSVSEGGSKGPPRFNVEQALGHCGLVVATRLGQWGRHEWNNDEFRRRRGRAAVPTAETVVIAGARALGIEGELLRFEDTRRRRAARKQRQPGAE
jgi:hypothetical protein